MKHVPTAEQVHAVDLYRTGGSLKLSALAGCAKTTTLQLMAESDRRRGLYLCFNKAIQLEAAARFPRNVTCKTTHALAWPSMAKLYATSKMTTRINANAAAQLLGLRDRYSASGTYTARAHGQLVLETVRKFTHSTDEAIGTLHVPIYPSMAAMPRDALSSLIRETVEHAGRLWTWMKNPANADVPLGHDGYLKLWAMERPLLNFDYVLLDEAQDSNPVVLQVLADQKAQLIYVGDRQQQIYEWRGAVNAMDTIKAHHNCTLTQSFRFGPPIAEMANVVLRLLGETIALRGHDATHSVVGCTRPDTILCRTNAGLAAQLMQNQLLGEQVHVVGGTDDLKRLLYAVNDLQRGMPTNHAEFFGFSSWVEVVEFSETEEGEYLASFVSLVEDYGVDAILQAAERAVPRESDASLVLSTAHKAKGREWGRVLVNADFYAERFMNPDGELDNEEEARLLYVAITRARHEIGVPPDIMLLLKEGQVASGTTTATRSDEHAQTPQA